MSYKSICILLLGGILASSSAEGCGNPTVQVYVKEDGAMGVRIVTEDTLNYSKLSAFHQIAEKLWYDEKTHIVYWWNGSEDTMPTPYYLSDGTIGFYDAESKTIEAIPPHEEPHLNQENLDNPERAEELSMETSPTH